MPLPLLLLLKAAATAKPVTTATVVKKCAVVTKGGHKGYKYAKTKLDEGQLKHLEHRIIQTGNQELIRRWKQLDSDRAIMLPLREKMKDTEQKELERIIIEFENAIADTDCHIEASLATARELNTKITDLNENIRRSLDRGRKTLGE